MRGETYLKLLSALLLPAVIILSGCGGAPAEPGGYQPEAPDTEVPPAAQEAPPTLPPAQEPPLPPQEPSPPPQAGWTADGVFADNEYLGEYASGKYEIRWRSDDQYVYMGIRAETAGWVAVGLEPTSGMKDADMIFGMVADGQTTVSDQFSTGRTGPHRPDTELGGSDDILEFAGSEEGGYTTIEFKRLLSTGDEYDNDLAPGTTSIIWSYSSADSLTQRHISRGSGEIIL